MERKMKVRKRIYSWNQASKGAKALAKELGWLRLTHLAKDFVPRPQHLVVNWGSSQMPTPIVETCRVVNRPENVAIAADKLATYEALIAGAVEFLPDYTTSIQEARDWLNAHPKHSMFCRTVLNGHGGQGIREARTPEELVPAPLYVEYVPKKEEYRVHVFGGNAKIVQKKARRMEVPDDQVDWRVRNHRNGFIFARDGVRAPDPVLRAAEQATRLLGLHFGAVDIGWNEKHQRAVIFEVNTAPGLEGTTVREYADYFRRLV